MGNVLLGGRYQTVRELGAGGMGRVYQAVDTSTGRAVAAKVLIPSAENKLESLLRFQQEGAVLSTLKHPNIVEVYGTFLESDTCCIIMELLEGRSLAQILRAEQLPLSRIKHLIAQVASALAFAHAQSIIHRDVKPDNIMVVGDDQVKVTDFGIARVLRTGATLNTAVGTSLGTPLYMAPEQIEGQKVDSRADIYALGAVMYQCVTGHPPFEGEDPLTVAFKHVHTPPQPPSEVADVPEDWEAVILKALAKDPGDRFQTAVSMETAVTALGTDALEPLFPPQRPAPRSAPTPEPRPVETNGKQASHPEVARAPSVVEPAAPATGTITSLPEAPSRPAVVTRPAGGQSRTPWLLAGGVGGLVVLGVLAFVFLHQSGSSSTPAPTAGRPASGTFNPIAIWGSSGSGSGQLNSPSAVTVDSQGQVYVADSGNNRALKFSASGNHQLAEFGSGGASGIAVDDQGNVYVTDSGSGHISKFSSGGKLLGTFTGFKNPTGLAFSQGSLYVADAGNNTVTKLSTSGQVTAGPWGTKGSNPLQFDVPFGVAADGSGNVFVADTGNNRVQELNPGSEPLGQWGTKGSGPLQFLNPKGVAVDSSGNIYVADTGNNRVQEISPAGKFVTQWGGAGSGNGQFSGPEGIAVDSSGNIYVADTGNNRVQEFAPRR